MRITKQKHAIEKEPLLSPFGFKGGYLSELWQFVTLLESESGATGIGLGVQSILWSDPNVFVRYGEERGNEMMSEVTRYALNEAEKVAFETPIQLMESLLAPAYDHGKKVTACPELRLTFALNALVSVDHAAWAVYAREKKLDSFLDLVPAEYREPLTWRHSSLAGIPVVSYGMEEEDIRELLEAGYFLLKIKIGADPDRDGDQEKMLAWDKERLSLVHRIAADYRSGYTESGRIAYYMDANGRYANKDYLLRFLDHADRLSALEHILLFEEPFPEEYKADVTDIPVRLAADESVHSERDALERIELGFRAMTLKPVAKTMSLSLKIAKLAHERGVPCFCADLTANPILVEWNKNLAACLAPLPGLKIGAIETNGHQNYLHWERMLERHPRHGAVWTVSQRGTYPLTEQFYRVSGGALERSPYYESLVQSTSE